MCDGPAKKSETQKTHRIKSAVGKSVGHTLGLA